jgi:hypothetical protein
MLTMLLELRGNTARRVTLHVVGSMPFSASRSSRYGSLPDSLLTGRVLLPILPDPSHLDAGCGKPPPSVCSDTPLPSQTSHLTSFSMILSQYASANCLSRVYSARMPSAFSFFSSIAISAFVGQLLVLLGLLGVISHHTSIHCVSGAAAAALQTQPADCVRREGTCRSRPLVHAECRRCPARSRCC